MALVAIAAGLVGLSGQAISTAASAGSMEEAADYLECEAESSFASAIQASRASQTLEQLRN